ncbi:TonB-dependent receptor [Novosphingobium sp. G106]|nr:TonB-dependent receptor [Novosphingobium sp. G106]
MNIMTSGIRTFMLVSTMLVPVAFAPVQAWAQEATATDNSNTGLQEIVVTAQKREQSMQDVPIAITAFTQQTLEANRIYNVNDLSGLAPGLTVRPSAGGIQLPAFTMRGQVSFGVVAGSDKQISIYLDNVYLSSPRGTIFDLPDVARIEVLRGPQGTLFGRNATGGAVSVTTRDPTGDPHVKAEFSYGNYDQYRIRFTADTPQIGPFSAYFSFVRHYQRGDIRNADAGVIWNRNSAGPRYGNTQQSVKWLGTTDSNSYFAAVKFEPSDSFKTVYKFDRNEDAGTPDGTGFVGYNPSAPLTGALVTALLNSQPTPYLTDPTARRPAAVNNGWVIPRIARVQGHSLTSTWQASDNISVKNIFAYRSNFIFSTAAIDGLSSFTFTPQSLGAYATLAAFSANPALATASPTVQAAAIQATANALAPNLGGQFVLIGTESTSASKQYSDELQVNYHTDKLQLTAGALWFHSNDTAGGPTGMQSVLSLVAVPPSGVVPLGRQGAFHNIATSLAAYLQLEYDFTDQLSLVAGGRITRDKKDSTFTYGNPGALNTIVPPTYKKTKPNYMVGLNWKPNAATLIYAKYSTSFVSGGSTGGIPYEPETASSIEAGLKADFLDHKLRTNLALFHVDYHHFQGPQGTSQLSSAVIAHAALDPLYGVAVANAVVPALSTFVFDQGSIRAQGVELEVTAAPARGLQLGGSLGYTDTKYPFVSPAVLAANNGAVRVTNRPKVTGTLWAMYETQPISGDMTLMLRSDANYLSHMDIDPQVVRVNVPQLEPARSVPAYWLFNARAALRHIKVGGLEGELAVWGKNLSDRKYANFALVQDIATSVNFIPPRTYGVDFGIEF